MLKESEYNKANNAKRVVLILILMEHAQREEVNAFYE